MLSIARSVAVVLSGNRMIYKFGPGGPTFKMLGGGALNVGFGIQLSYPLLFLIVLTIIMAVVYKMTAWGRHVLRDRRQRAGGAPDRRAGQPRQGAGLCRLRRSRPPFAAMLSVGWQGSAINALGTGYELRAIAAAVIGGANLMGGEGERLRRLHRRGAASRSSATRC